MKLKNKLSILVTSLITTFSTAVAHSGDEGGTTTGMMWGDGGMMHNAGHMTGYNMWGPGWIGMLFGITLWALAVLGIIFLYQKLTEEE